MPLLYSPCVTPFLKLKPSDIDRYPTDPPTVRREKLDFLTPLQEALRKSDETAHRGEPRAKCIAGLISPTGAGKSSFLTSLAITLYWKYGLRTTYVTPGKNSRVDVMLRLTEAIAKMLDDVDMVKKGKIPRVLVVFSKIEICPHPEIMQLYSSAKEAEDSGDFDTAEKLRRAAYARCRLLVRQGRCKYYTRDRKELEKLAKAVESSYIYVAGRISEEILEEAKRRAPSAIRDGVISFMADLSELGRNAGVCPFEAAKTLAERADIIVLDTYYVALRSKPWAREFLEEAFNGERVVVLDEAHEYPFNTTAKVTLNYEKDTPNILYRVGLGSRLKNLFDKVFSRNDLVSGTVEFGNTAFEYRTAEDRLPSDIIAEVQSIGNLALRAARNARGRLADLLLAEGELLVESARIEKAYSVSRAARRPGVLVFVREKRAENGSWRTVRDYMIPVILSPHLMLGRDFRASIAASATLTTIHMSQIYHMRRETASELLATVKWPGLLRRTFIVNTSSYLENRPQIAQAIAGIAGLYAARGIDKGLVIAPLSWEPLLRETLSSVGFEYYSILPGRTTEASVRMRQKAAEALTKPGRAVVHISPHTSIARAVDLVPPEVEYAGFVFAASEAILAPGPDSIAVRAVLTHKYGVPDFLAFVSTQVTPAVIRVIQSIGRTQRSERHEVDVWLFGKFFKGRLETMRYEELYGYLEVAYSGDPDPTQIIEAARRVLS